MPKWTDIGRILIVGSGPIVTTRVRDSRAVRQGTASAVPPSFVTSRTWESRALFVRDHPACTVFVQTLAHYRQQGAFKLHAFVLMPDHFHVLLTPGETLSLERAVQFIKGGSARNMGKQFGSRFPVWQRGFSDHRVRDARDYAQHVEYIHRNPVKRGLALKPGEFLWSSASGHFDLDEPPQGLKPQVEMSAVRHG